jgi:hypothetical protein
MQNTGTVANEGKQQNTIRTSIPKILTVLIIYKYGYVVCTRPQISISISPKLREKGKTKEMKLGI